MTFSDEREVLDTICGLQDHRVSPEELPKIRVARKNAESPFFSVDNQRLFAFLVARIPEISAVEICWFSEFENKLAQRSRRRAIAKAARSSNIDELLSRRNGGGLSQTMLASTLQSGVSSSAKRCTREAAHTVVGETPAVTRDIQ
eukprot:gnl/TRDRNA2_/TRDRNA2_79763_c1_seq1.p1 gnl/TRDRNA2_/TRDRNA2_79763_c1~~gnl/TRDRNA2_/TRDRNA2_79763_c1_seq1.p1  ORF type:complete len:145 (+),score=10.20 gnl/TRDRNA2_/TRDRNA2_79763_c1_seq1:375-809(+)